VILVDTSVLSAALRRRSRGPAEEEAAKRIDALLKGEEEVALPGTVFQEILSGVSDRAQRDKLLTTVRASFPVALATEGDHIMAADLATQAAKGGIRLSTPDALIAAQAINRRARLLTTDGDFLPLADAAGLKLL
jgi:predicted nucleic acid-binding protein